jgi:hypothetical protein
MGFRISRVLDNRTLHDSSHPTRLPSFIMGTRIPTLETYQYTSLRPGDSTFRLLKLLKYRSPEIECELFPQSLSNKKHVSYEALSYVWGSTELVECIILDRKRHWITDNLYSALQYLRFHDRDRYLWIDAICINQADKEEQGCQVQQMGKIFGSAEGVLFWLGKATVEITSLMDALNSIILRKRALQRAFGYSGEDLLPHEVSNVGQDELQVGHTVIMRCYL